MHCFFRSSVSAVSQVAKGGAAIERVLIKRNVDLRMVNGLARAY